MSTWAMFWAFVMRPGDGRMSDHPFTSLGVRPTGVWLLPPRFARRLGFWSAWTQRNCPHEARDRRWIGGDERLYGYRQQCMACGLLYR